MVILASLGDRPLLLLLLVFRLWFGHGSVFTVMSRFEKGRTTSDGEELRLASNR
jgi:hypothetical protein